MKMKKANVPSFRASESIAGGRERAVSYYTRHLDPKEREDAVDYIDHLIRQYGPVVDGYPSWHPFTSIEGADGFEAEITPQEFERLDHAIYFRDAFVTAPCGGVKDVIKSADNKKSGYIVAEEISDVALYNSSATPVLVRCEGIEKETDGTIAKRFALGSMLSNELPAWKTAHCGETWATMRRYILGTPCGLRSSLFVNQETGQALREVFELLNYHELFGPVYDR